MNILYTKIENYNSFDNFNEMYRIKSEISDYESVHNNIDILNKKFLDNDYILYFKRISVDKMFYNKIYFKNYYYCSNYFEEINKIITENYKKDLSKFIFDYKIVITEFYENINYLS